MLKISSKWKNYVYICIMKRKVHRSKHPSLWMKFEMHWKIHKSWESCCFLHLVYLKYKHLVQVAQRQSHPKQWIKKDKVIQSIESRKLNTNEVHNVHEVVLNNYKVFFTNKARRLKFVFIELTNRSANAKFRLASLEPKLGNISCTYGRLLDETFIELGKYIPSTWVI